MNKVTSKDQLTMAINPQPPNPILTTFLKGEACFINYIQSREEGKDQESIQSSTLPQTHNITHNRAKRSALSQQVNRQDSTTKTNMKHKQQTGSTKETPPWNGHGLLGNPVFS